MKASISVIYNIKENVPVGVISMTPQNGDVAYSTEDNELVKTLDILLDNKLFLLKNENVKGAVFLVEETVDTLDSYFIMALNYSLPLPWWITDIYEDYGEVEDLSKKYYDNIVRDRSDKDEQIKKKNG